MIMNIQKFYDESACSRECATGWQLFFRDIEKSIIRNHIRNSGIPNPKILDVGCGNGFVAEYMRRGIPGSQIWGIDNSPGMIKEAKSTFPHMNNNFLLNDALYIDFPPNTFDFVYTIRTVINLMSTDRQLTAMKEIYRVLKDGGTAIVIEMSQSGHDNMNSSLRKMGLKALDMRWHNKFLDEDAFELGCDKIGFLFIKQYLPVTSALKYTIEALIGSTASQSTPKYSRKKEFLNKFTNFMGRMTYPMDRIMWDKCLGRHVVYYMKKADGMVIDL
jgi:ubiquinone/menaquinone biosynthesis C-methylase UbiE